MESKGEIETQALEFKKLEEIFEDRDGDILNHILSFGPVYQLKTKLQAFKYKGIDMHGVYQSFSTISALTKP